jgi:hypothetical protein
MADDVEAQEIHATITSVGTREEPLDDDQMEPSDVVGEPEDEDEDEDDDHLTRDDVTDSDAVIVDDVTPVRAGDVSGRDEDEEEDADEDADGDEVDEPDDVSAYGHPADEDADDEAHPETVPAEAILADPAPSETTVPDPVTADPIAADDAAADDALDGDREPVSAYAMPAAPADPASVEALPKHARPAAAVPEAARPGMPSDVSDPAEGDLVGDSDQWHERWAAIQSTFVDDPRGSVEAAAGLVGETINALVTAAKERETGLRGEWDREDADTEDLRNTLRNYRGLLDRLIAV